MVILGRSFCMEGIGGAQDSRVLPKKIVQFFVVGVFCVCVCHCVHVLLLFLSIQSCLTGNVAKLAYNIKT